MFVVTPSGTSSSFQDQYWWLWVPAQGRDDEVSRVSHNYVAGIGIAVICIIDGARPFVVRDSFHRLEDVDANDRTFCQRGVGIFVVDLRFSGRRIDRAVQPDNDLAKRGAAMADADLRIAGLGQPDTGRITGAFCPSLTEAQEKSYCKQELRSGHRPLQRW